MRSSRNSLQAVSLRAVEAEIPCTCGKVPHSGHCDVMTAAYSDSFRQAKIAERRRAASEPKPILRVFDVHLTLTIDTTSDRGRDADEGLLEEAITQMVDEEIAGHTAGGTRCGLRFYDAWTADARFVEDKPREDQAPTSRKARK